MSNTPHRGRARVSNPVYISMEPLGSIRDLTVKFPTPGGKSCVKSPGKSPMQPSRGRVGQHIDRCVRSSIALVTTIVAAQLVRFIRQAYLLMEHSIVAVELKKALASSDKGPTPLVSKKKGNCLLFTSSCKQLQFPFSVT